MQKECIHYKKVSGICKMKNVLASKTTCTKKCYSYDNNPLHIKLHKDIIWTAINDGFIGYISGIKFFKIEIYKDRYLVTTTINSFVEQNFASVNDCKEFADRAMTIYLKRITDV